MAHLRSGESQEWTSFPEKTNRTRLTVNFESTTNAGPVTLGLRRIDVKQDWRLLLNDQLVGKIVNDENDMQDVWELPAGALNNGQNTLLIEPTNDLNDDIYVGDIWLDRRPRHEVLGEVTVTLSAFDPAGDQLPCRFTILNSDDSLAALGAESNRQIAVRTGVVYAATGEAKLGLASGDYTIYCGRGSEYELKSRQLKLERGATEKVDFTLERVVDTSGLIACDTHVHTFEISRHGDASLIERMITLAGEGIENLISGDRAGLSASMRTRMEDGCPPRPMLRISSLKRRETYRCSLNNCTTATLPSLRLALENGRIPERT